MKMRDMSQGRNGEAGFTLIEMMISMTMGLVIIAGLSLVFNTNSKISSAITSRTERMSDLYLASQLMQAGLRESMSVTAPAYPADLAAGGRKPAAICSAPNSQSVSIPANYPASFPYLPYWDATSKTLTYQDMDGNTGIFHYQHTQTDRLYWLRPDPCVYQFQELLRDLDTTNGLVVSPTSAGGPVSITLQSTYSNEQHQGSTLSLSFKLWPRN